MSYCYGILSLREKYRATFDVVQTLHENLVQQIANRKKDAAPLEVSRKEIAAMLGTCNVPEKELVAFDNEYLEQFGAVGMQAAAIAEPKKFELTTENVTIQVDPTRTDLVETRRIDGKRYILIAVEGEAAVNGVEINIP